MPACTIEIHASSFRSGSKAAGKRHRSFAKELQAIFTAIESDPHSQGAKIRSNNPAEHIRKVRIGAPGEFVKPSAGYRLIYQVIETNEKTIARCLDLYYKPEQSTVLPHQVDRLVDLAIPAPPEPELS